MTKPALEGITARQRFARGETIFREREKASCAFVIESGVVEIWTRLGAERKVLSVLGPGEMFGELAALDGTERSATATAIENTELTLIVQEQLRSRVEAADPVLRLLLRMILNRFRYEQNLLRPLATGRLDSVDAGAEVEVARLAIDKIKLESRAPQRIRSRGARAPLPAFGQPCERPHCRVRSAAAMEASRARLHSSRQVHPSRRGNGAHRAHRTLCAGAGLPRPGGAPAPARGAAHDERERLGAAVRGTLLSFRARRSDRVERHRPHVPQARDNRRGSDGPPLPVPRLDRGLQEARGGHRPRRLRDRVLQLELPRELPHRYPENRPLLRAGNGRRPAKPEDIRNGRSISSPMRSGSTWLPRASSRRRRPGISREWVASSARDSSSPKGSPWPLPRRSPQPEDRDRRPAPTDDTPGAHRVAMRRLPWPRS